MSLLTTYDALVNAGSGAVLLAFGIWVLTLTPRKRSTVSLGLFAVTFGLFLVAWNILTVDDPLWSNGAFLAVTGGLGLLATGLLIDVSVRIPRPLGRRDLRLLVLPTIFLLAWAWPLTRTVGADVEDAIPFSLSVLVQAVFFFLLAVAALRHHREEDAANRQQLRMLSAALVLYPATAVGHFLVDGRYTVPLLGVALLGLLAALWLRNAWLTPGDEARACRNLALLGPAVGLGIAVFVHVALPTFSGPADGPHWGVARMLAVLALAYAILRHQLLGLDAKVRRGISRSTMAGVFVAVFFIVSEGAQELFSGFAGSQWLGILAAGGLVFVLAPLQRLADHVAARAVPGPPSAGARGSAHATYRSALRVALSDGEISREEEHELALLQREVGLDPVEALDLRREEETRRAST